MSIKTEETEILADAFADIAIQLAFVFAEDPDENNRVVNEPHMQARVLTSVYADRRISILAPLSICQEIAGNVIGHSGPTDSISVQLAADALMEVCNNLASEFMMKLVPDVGLYDLSVPEIDMLNYDEAQGVMKDPTRRIFHIDNKLLSIHVA